MVDQNGSSKFCPDCGDHRPAEECTRDRRRRDGLAFYGREHARRRLRASKERRRGAPRHRFALDRVVREGHTWCPDCDSVKPLEEFPRTPASRTGRATDCLPCHNLRGKASKDKVGGSRTYHLKRRYGRITAEEADTMLAAQGGLCAICRGAPAAHVDHDHQTGRVRQMLCLGCNGGLGQFRDDPAALRAAAGYVERHRALPAPGDETASLHRAARRRPASPATRSRGAGCSSRDRVRTRVAALVASRERTAPG